MIGKGRCVSYLLLVVICGLGWVSFVCLRISRSFLYHVLSHSGISIEIKSSDITDMFVFKLLLKLNVNFAGTQNLNI